jgi:hypothetical protein
MSRLHDLRRMLAPNDPPVSGVVEEILAGQRVTVRLADGSLRTCAGVADVGQTVVVQSGVVVARTARQATRKYHVVL